MVDWGMAIVIALEGIAATFIALFLLQLSASLVSYLVNKTTNK